MALVTPINHGIEPNKYNLTQDQVFDAIETTRLVPENNPNLRQYFVEVKQYITDCDGCEILVDIDSCMKLVFFLEDIIKLVCGNNYMIEVLDRSMEGNDEPWWYTWSEPVWHCLKPRMLILVEQLLN